MSEPPITNRVLILRILNGVMSTALIYFGATALCRTLKAPERFANAALFTIFCSQMLCATIVHVANDGLAAGLSALFLAALARFVKAPGGRSAFSTAAWLTAGLLTKAYFLVFALLMVAVSAALIKRRRTQWNMMLTGAVLVLALAGPWYARNLFLYGDASGTHEEFDGMRQLRRYEGRCRGRKPVVHTGAAGAGDGAREFGHVTLEAGGT